LVPATISSTEFAEVTISVIVSDLRFVLTFCVMVFVSKLQKKYSIMGKREEVKGKR